MVAVEHYERPTVMERGFNRAFGMLVGLGLGMRHNYLLEVRGRRTGQIHAMPVSVLDLNGRRFLVAGRGRTHWVRNAEAAGEVALKKGRVQAHYRLRAVPDVDKPEVLKAYVDRFTTTVQRYFPVPAGSPAAAFAAVASRYPVFELLPER